MDSSQQPPDIFTRLGMVSASDEQKQQLTDQLADLTMVRVFEKLDLRLTPEQMAELERMTAAGQEEQVEMRLLEWVPGYEQLVQETAAEVADQLVADQQSVLAKVREQAAR